MRDLSLAIPQGLGRRNTKTVNTTAQINLLLLVLISLISFAYLFFINSIGTRGFEIKKLEQQLVQLELNQKKLQVQASDLQSINKIQQEAKKLNFVPATNVTYMKDSDYALK